MKNSSRKIAAMVLGMALCGAGIIGCAADKAPKGAPKIEGATQQIRVDKSTDKLNLMDGITAKDGNGKDITSRVTVKIQGGGYLLEDGIVEFTECGDYTIEYTVDDGYGQTDTFEMTVAVRNVYSVYLINASVPALYAALDIAATDYKFILAEDRSTVNASVYGERVVFNSPDGTKYNDAVSKFHELYNNDEYSYFRMFFPDVRNQLLLKTIVSEKIPESRYEVKYLSDGSMSYNTSFPYRGENAAELWDRNMDIYNNMYKLAEENKELTYGDITLGGDFLSYELHNAYIVAATKSNAEFWGAYPECLKSGSAEVQAEIEKSHLIKKQPEKMYESLSSERKNKFLNSVSFDKKTFDEQYFDSEGKYLIITGANSVSGKLSNEQFIEVLRDIANDYADYNILFKPHPASVPSQEYFQALGKNITILPGRLPMEVISWVYSDALIGGFDSSLYMSVPQGNVAFFIAQDKTKLSAVSSILYETGVFGESKFYWI